MTQYRGFLPQDSRNLKGEYGNSDFDTRHSFTALVNYRPPVSKHWKLLSNGWQTSALLSFHTGQPFTIYTGGDNSGTDEGFQRPNLVGDPFASVSHQIQADSSGAKCAVGESACVRSAHCWNVWESSTKQMLRTRIWLCGLLHL